MDIRDNCYWERGSCWGTNVSSGLQALYIYSLHVAVRRLIVPATSTAAARPSLPAAAAPGYVSSPRRINGAVLIVRTRKCPPLSVPAVCVCVCVCNPVHVHTRFARSSTVPALRTSLAGPTAKPQTICICIRNGFDGRLIDALVGRKTLLSSVQFFKCIRVRN